MRFLLAHCWLIAGSLLSMLLANDQLGSHFGSQSAVGTLDSGDTTWHWLVRRQKLTLSCLDSCGARWRTSFFTFLSRFRSKMDPCCLVHEKRKKFSWKSYSKPWKASHLSVFVWIVTLTVAFCDGVSRNSKFSWVVRTNFLPSRPVQNLKRPLAAIAIQKRRGKKRDSFLAAKSSPNLGWISSK